MLNRVRQFILVWNKKKGLQTECTITDRNEPLFPSTSASRTPPPSPPCASTGLSKHGECIEPLFLGYFGTALFCGPECRMGRSRRDGVEYVMLNSVRQFILVWNKKQKYYKQNAPSQTLSPATHACKRAP